jgi:sulfide:quinone oxidoreductase
MSDPALRVLIAGGGVAGLETLLGLHALSGGRVDIELLSEEPELVNRPSSVGQPFGHPPPRRLDVAKIAAEHGARFRAGRLSAVHVERHEAETAEGARTAYDVLVVAVGATAEHALPGALVFRGPPDVARFRELLRDIHLGRARRVVFAVPAGAYWPLPLYELALQTAARVRALGLKDVGVALATPEERPLALFGPAASEAVSELLGEAEIEVVTSAHLAAVEDALRLAPAHRLAADRVVTMPRLRGPALAWLPADSDGFLPVDLHGAVRGVPDVYAAGDVTSFPIKQGGLAAPQADAVAEVIAARAGAPVDPLPFKPVLRGMLLTGRARRYLQSGIAGGQDEDSRASELPLWWPPTKVVGQHLSSYLVSAFPDTPQDAPDDPAKVRVEAPLAT